MEATGPSFEEYWRAFVRAYELPTARRLLILSISAGIGSAVFGALARRPFLVALAPVVAFVPPWLVRRIAGASPPGGVSRPVFYAAACLKLWRLTLSGQMEDELSRVVRTAPPSARPEADPEASYPRPNMVTDHTLH